MMNYFSIIVGLIVYGISTGILAVLFSYSQYTDIGQYLVYATMLIGVLVIIFVGSLVFKEENDED